MKKLILLIIMTIMIVILGMNISATSFSDMPEDVRTVAESSVSMIKSKMISDPQKWGFENESEIKRLTLGDGYKVKFVGKEQITSASGDSIEEIIDESIIDTWEFTLDLDGNSMIFLTVAYEGGAYRVTHYGGDATSFGIAKANISQVARNKGLTTGQELLKANGKYYFFATGETDIIVPVQDNETQQIDNITLRNVEKEVDFMSTAEFVRSLKSSTESTEYGQLRGGSIPTVSANAEYKWVVIVLAVVFFAISVSAIHILKKEGR